MQEENIKEKKEKTEPTLGERLKLERVGTMCRCGKSKKKPYCDGSHKY